jgi:hypothetical protein
MNMDRANLAQVEWQRPPEDVYKGWWLQHDDRYGCWHAIKEGASLTAETYAKLMTLIDYLGAV